MTYQKIAIIGATGKLGQQVTRALVEEGFDVTPFSRQDTTVAGLRTQKLRSLFGFDAVVSTVGHAGMSDQLSLIEQAKNDGVKRFVPSEFGVDHRHIQHPFFEEKVKVFEAVQQANFPDGWTAIGSGFFDFVIPAFVQVLPESSTITFRGTGQKQFPFTVAHDIGQVLAQSFKDPAAFKDKWLNVANAWLSLRQIANTINQQSNLGFRTESVDVDENVPVLQIFEAGDFNVFEHSRQATELPVKLSDLASRLTWSPEAGIGCWKE